MKLAKKIITSALAAFMTLSVVACTGGTAGKKPIELVLYSQLANFSGEQIGWAAQLLKDKFNVKLIIINDAIDGTFATRMANGNLGDIVLFGSDGNQYQDAIKAGMLLPWEQDNLLKDNGPYIEANMQNALEKNKEISGGTLYGFGYDVAGNSNDHQLNIYYPYLRWDLYQQLGEPPINTLEDFIPILQQMQQLDPTSDIGTKTYGVSSFPDWDGDTVMMVKATAALYGWEELGMGLYNVTTGEFQGALQDGGMYLRCLKFYNKLNQLGLFDPDSMTQTFDDASKKYKNGTSFWNIFTFVAETYNTQEHLDAGKAIECVPAADQTNVATGLNVYGGNRVWTIGAKTNYPELCMQIINWLCTPEGVLDYNYGPQGVTWDYDQNGNTYLTDVGLQIQANDKKTMINFDGVDETYEDGEFQHNNTTWAQDSVNPQSKAGETFNWKNWASTILNMPVTPIEQSWRDWSGYTSADAFLDNTGKVVTSIGSKFAISTRDAALDTTWEQVKMAIRSGSWSAIYAKTDAEYDQIVAKMISDAKAYGYDDCMVWNQQQAVLRKQAEDAVTQQ